MAAANGSGRTYSGTVHVEVHSGQNLISADTNGFSDPYVKVGQTPHDPTLSKKAQKAFGVKTPVCKKTLNPEWGFASSFAVSDAIGVEFLVKDDDKVGHNDPLGEATLPLADLCHGRGVDTELRLVPGPHPDLPPALGSISVSIRFESSTRLFPVYGVDLGTALDNDMELASESGGPQPVDGVPSFLRALGDGILARGGTTSEGIFRVPGSASAIAAIKEAANFGELHTLLGDTGAGGICDVASLSGAFKLWFRELPEPLIPDALYDSATAVSSPEAAESVIRELDDMSQNVVEYLAKFLLSFTEDAAAVDLSKMDRKNIAMVFGPSLLRAPNDIRLMQDSDAIRVFVMNVLAFYAP